MPSCAAVGRSGGTVVKNTGDGDARCSVGRVAVQVKRRVARPRGRGARRAHRSASATSIGAQRPSGLVVHVACAVAVGGSGEIIVTGSLRIAVTGEAASFGRSARTPSGAFRADRSNPRRRMTLGAPPRGTMQAVPC
jgi:hypothetical protein